MNTEFASAGYTAGQLNAIVKLLKKQAGENGPERFLRGELTVFEAPRKWWEQDGVIYFSVTSDGTTGSQWIERLEKKGFRVGDYAKSVLCSDDFKPTKGIKTKIAILKGIPLEDSARITKKIRTEADRRNLTKPNAEVACLIREMFTEKEIETMGLWCIVAMHEPIKNSDGAQFLPRAFCFVFGRWLSAYYGIPGFGWCRAYGFAFVVSQVQVFPQN